MWSCGPSTPAAARMDHPGFMLLQRANAVKKYARSPWVRAFSWSFWTAWMPSLTDPKWVEFILGQLVSNAVKYRGPQPRLTFSQRVEAASVTLIVADNGPGIRLRTCLSSTRALPVRTGGCCPPKSTGLGALSVQKLCDRLGLGLVLALRGGQRHGGGAHLPKEPFHLAE